MMEMNIWYTCTLSLFYGGEFIRLDSFFSIGTRCSSDVGIPVENTFLSMNIVVSLGTLDNLWLCSLVENEHQYTVCCDALFPLTLLNLSVTFLLICT